MQQNAVTHRDIPAKEFVQQVPIPSEICRNKQNKQKRLASHKCSDGHVSSTWECGKSASVNWK